MFQSARLKILVHIQGQQNAAGECDHLAFAVIISVSHQGKACFLKLLFCFPIQNFDARQMVRFQVGHHVDGFDFFIRLMKWPHTFPHCAVIKVIWPQATNVFTPVAETNQNPPFKKIFLTAMVKSCGTAVCDTPATDPAVGTGIGIVTVLVVDGSVEM
jgi:hypothetical protein